MKSISSLFTLLVFITSCNGQVKPSQKNTTAHSEHTTSKAGNTPKIIRSQNTPSGNVNCELVDKNGDVWFSISGEGVYRYDGMSFTNFTTKDGLSSNNTGPIIQDRHGNILIGTGKGICKYDGKKFTNFPQDITKKVSITCLLEDNDGNLWFGTMEGGVYRYDGKKLKSFLNNDDHPFNLGAHYQLIQDILQDKQGNIWFCSWNGGGVWKYNGKSFQNFVPSAEYYKTNEDGRSVPDKKQKSIAAFQPENIYTQPTTNISDDMINSVTEDSKGNLWFATRRHGACRYDGTSFVSFREKEGFVSYGITNIIEDSKGTLWLGTDKNGVFCYDGKKFKKYTTNDGLVNNSVRSILEDNNGNLWFGTRWFGLSRYDRKIFTTFSGEEFNK